MCSLPVIKGSRLPELPTAQKIDLVDTTQLKTEATVSVVNRKIAGGRENPSSRLHRVVQTIKLGGKNGVPY